VTVTAVVCVASGIVIGSVTLAPTLTITSFCVTVANPLFEATSVYVPTGRTGKKNSPLSSLVVAEETPVSEIAALLSERGIKRVPVVSNGRVVGIVSRADIVQAVAQGHLVLRQW